MLLFPFVSARLGPVGNAVITYIYMYFCSADVDFALILLIIKRGLKLVFGSKLMLSLLFAKLVIVRASVLIKD
jgi:hypothetical protein